MGVLNGLFRQRNGPWKNAVVDALGCTGHSMVGTRAPHGRVAYSLPHDFWK